MNTRLDDESVERIAQRVAQLILGRQTAPRWVSTRQAAGLLGISEGWLRKNKGHFTHIKGGGNEQGRLRFDAQRLFEEYELLGL